MMLVVLNALSELLAGEAKRENEPSRQQRLFEHKEAVDAERDAIETSRKQLDALWAEEVKTRLALEPEHRDLDQQKDPALDAIQQEILKAAAIDGEQPYNSELEDLKTDPA